MKLLALPTSNFQQSGYSILKMPDTTLVICFVFCRLLLKVIVSNSVDPEQAVWSGSILFAYMQKVCLTSLQEDAADNMNRWHFQM